jgi:hypothetical protein
VLDMIRGCQSREALGRVQDRYRSMLTSLSRERSDLYGTIGAAIAARRVEVAAPEPCAPRAKQDPPAAEKRVSRAQPEAPPKRAPRAKGKEPAHV